MFLSFMSSFNKLIDPKEGIIGAFTSYSWSVRSTDDTKLVIGIWSVGGVGDGQGTVLLG